MTAPEPTPTAEHIAREVFTADGIPFVRCSCSTAKSPTSSRWLAEHVPNGGVPLRVLGDHRPGAAGDASEG